jgi:hypothetical protein
MADGPAGKKAGKTDPKQDLQSRYELRFGNGLNPRGSYNIGAGRRRG